MRLIGLAVLLASLAAAQESEHAFTLQHPDGRREILVALRGVAQIYKVTADESNATLAVRGTPDQMALAEWLVPKLDAASGSGAGEQEYRVPGTGDIILVFKLEHASPRSMQEIATTLRTVAEISEVSTTRASRSIALRGDAGKVAFARFLLTELDQPEQPRPTATVREFKMNDSNLGTAVVYGLAHTDDARSVLEIMTTLRAVGDIAKVFIVTAPRMLAVSGSASDVQLAEWLISELDQPAAKAAGNETRVPGGDDVVHVFYLAHLTAGPAMSGLLEDVRNTAHIVKSFSNSVPPAIVLRGTAEQLAVAGRLIESEDLVH